MERAVDITNLQVTGDNKMHSVLEIIMPQVDDVEIAVEQVMRKFSEHLGSEDDDYCGHSFWDFYVIGGRWAGHKLQAGLDKGRLDSFYADMKAKNVTVSGLQCGKQEISPASQIPMVDELWASYFPEYQGRACPLFNHSNNQYENDCLYGDVMRLKDVSKDVTCSMLIIANDDYKGEMKEAKEMFSTSIWNGVSFEKTTWDGTLGGAMKLHSESMRNYKQEYVDENTPADDWLVITVDYHS